MLARLVDESAELVETRKRKNPVELLPGALVVKLPEVLRPKVDGRPVDERYRTGLIPTPTYSSHRRRRNRRTPDAGSGDC